MYNHIKLLIALCLLFGFIVNTHSQSQRVVADKIVAIVDDEAILQSAIDDSLKDSRQRGVQQDKCELIRRLIISKLLAFEAIKDTLPPVDENEEEDPYMRLRNKSPRARTAEEMRQKILDGIAISSDEVKQYYNKLPKAGLPKFETQYELSQIIVYPKPSKESEQRLIIEMNNYRSQIESKKVSFNDLSKKVSEYTGSEEIEFHRYTRSWDSAFVTAAFRLKEGEISAPIRSNQVIILSCVYAAQETLQQSDISFGQCLYRMKI
jgi:peptidyl-prolyl cis-trans isomerase SurA